MGTFARRSPAPGYPINLPILDPRPEDWGMPIAREFVEQRAPSVKHNEEAIRWYASYIVRGASPGAAQTLHEMNCEIDVRHVLPTVGVPTLVIYREDEYLKEATRYMGEHIPGAARRARCPATTTSRGRATRTPCSTRSRRSWPPSREEQERRPDPHHGAAHARGRGRRGAATPRSCATSSRASAASR